MLQKNILYFIIVLNQVLLGIELQPVNIESSKLDNTQLESSQTINIVDKKKLETFSINDIQGLSSIVSNTNISGLGGRSDKTFTLRGISNYVTYESSVAIYVDDVPVPFSYGFGAVDFSNIESIEVLKGPQGTLFGKAAQSGVINIYTNAPTKEFKNKIRLGYGEYNSKELYGRVSGPTTNKELTYSLSLTKNSKDGYSNNIDTGNSIDKKDFIGLSTKLHYNPNSNLDLSLNYSKSISDDGPAPYKINSKENIRTIDGVNNGYVKMDNDLLSLVLKYKEDNYKFTSLSTYSKEDILKRMSIDILGGLILDFDIDIQEITQEFRLNYNFENSELLVGAFYSDKLKFDYKENQTLTTPNISSPNDLKNPDENIALFSQYSYYLGDNYLFMAGLRYQETQRNFNRSLTNFSGVETHSRVSKRWKHILPTLSLSYYGEDNSHTYITYSKGHRPGGYNYRAVDLTPHEAEITNSYELGYKKIYNNSITLNSALFYNHISEQRNNTFTDTLASITVTLPEAHSYGAEIELNYKNENTNIYATLGYTQAKYTNVGTQTYLENNNIIDVPNLTASFGGKYKIDSNYYFQSDLKYMGERYYNMSNTAKESGYTLANMAIGYTKETLGLQVYANNLFDEEYVDFMIYTPSNNYYHFGAPRVVGFKLSQSF